MENAAIGKNNHRVLIFAGLMASLLIYALDSTVFSTAMGKIVAEIGGRQYYSWPFTIYMLCSTVIIPLSGTVSDIYGHKPVFLAGIVTFLTGSLLCGFSHSMIQLVIFRGIQGIGGGIILSSVFTTVADLCKPCERGRYTGIVTSMFGVASIIGPSIGGFLSDNAGWRWIFFMNLPIGAAAFLILLFALPINISKHCGKADFAGMCMLVLALVPMLFVFSVAGSSFSWGSPQAIGLLVFSAAAFVFLAFIESKAENPTLPPEFFRSRGVNVCFIISFLNQAVMFAAIIYVPYFCQAVAGMSATSAGFVITPMMIALLAASNITGQLISSTGKCRILAVSAFCICVAGMWLLSVMNSKTPYLWIILFSVLTGYGVGVNMPVSNVNAQNSVDRRKIGSVTSSVMFFKNAGRTVGTAVFGAVMAGTAVSGNQVSVPVYSISNVFVSGIIISAIGAVCSAFLKDAPFNKNKPVNNNTETPAVKE